MRNLIASYFSEPIWLAFGSLWNSLWLTQ